MFPRISVIRKDERAVAWAAFALLFALMMAHALLDTARDALFLSSIPATRLPVVSLLIAGSAVAVLGVQKRLNLRLQRRAPLSGYLGVGAVVTGGVWWLLPSLGDAGLYVLYVWSSLLVTVVLVEFWLSMGRVLSARQAKRLYAFVGTGSVAGATAGYAVAGVVASQLGTNALLPTAALVMLVSAAIPGRLPQWGAPEEPARQVEAAGAKLLLLPYVRKVAALVLVGTVAVTLATYLFKASLAASVPAHELGVWFAAINLVLNVSALVVQLLLTAPLVRLLGVTRSATVLPAALSVGALGAMLGFGLPAALALKGADGTLRHTLSRTVRELLYVPLPERLRDRVKGLIDIVGQRGGQAVASACILGLIALGLDERALGALLLGLVAAWIGVAVMLRAPYLAVFRSTLDQLATEPELAFPELDLASIESLVEALSSQNDKMVVAALEILERQGKAKLVPALLLYHPSTDVVTAALSAFTRAERTDFIPIADKLQGNANPTVHAAVVRAKSAVRPDVEYLEHMARSPCRATRTTSVVYLHALQAVSAQDAATSLAALRDHDNRITAELAIARAAPHADTPLVRGVLVELLEGDDVSVAIEAATAMARIGAADFLPALVPKLADRALRADIVGILPSLGAPALDHLDATLRDPTQPEAVRREVPTALGRFPAMSSVPVLLRGMADANGAVKYRAIITLERLLHTEPSLAESPVGWGPGSGGRSWLIDEVEGTLTQIYEFIDRRTIMGDGAEADPSRATDAHTFLVRLLRDKQRHAEERLVRLIGLLHPSEDFGSIWRGLSAKQSRVRASSQELLDHLVEPRLRQPVGALFDDCSDGERLTAGSGHYAPAPRDYSAVLSVLVDSGSPSVSALAVIQVGELGLEHLRPQLTRMPEPQTGALREVLQRTLVALGEPMQAGVPS